MSMRGEFAAALQAALPDDRVIDHAYQLDGLDAHVPVVMLERTVIGKAPNQIGGYLATFNVHAISPVTGRDTADDELDDLADRVITALDGFAYCQWDTATRSVFLEKWPSYLIAVHLYGNRSEGIG